MIQIRPGTDADKADIVTLIGQVFGEDQAERANRQWQWQWHGDPRLGKPGYRGVVAVWRNRIIANLACIPAGLFIEGELVEAHWCVDVLTHWGLTRQALREYKRKQVDAGADLSRGIAAALLDHPSAGPVQLAKHIADPMKAICLRIGFEELAHSGNFSRRLSFRQSLQASLGPTLGAILSVPMDLPLAAVARPKLPVETMEGLFDARFDRFWGRLKRAYKAIALRDAATLNWRYRTHPDSSYTTLIMLESGEIRGYLVLSIYRHGERQRAKIVDLQTEPGDERAIRDLFVAALRFARERRADRIGCFVTGALVEDSIVQLGFKPRFKKSSKRLQPLIARGLPVQDLNATAGDGDGG